MKNHRYLLVCIFLAISTIAVYRQVSGYGFVHFDDNEYVYENPNVITGFMPNNINWHLRRFIRTTDIR